jgi:hypothetical protein
MDHRPFKDWLIENKRLTPAEKNQLGAHLQVCTSCKAIAEVDLALKTARVESPRQGFAKRFELRLADRKKVLHRRNAWGFSLLAAGVTGMLIFLFWPFLKGLVQSPVDVLGSWLTSLISFWSNFQALFHTGQIVFRVVPGFVPVFVWIVLVAAAGAWGLIWVFSILKITRSLQLHR